MRIPTPEREFPDSARDRNHDSRSWKELAGILRFSRERAPQQDRSWHTAELTCSPGVDSRWSLHINVTVALFIGSDQASSEA